MLSVGRLVRASIHDRSAVNRSGQPASLGYCDRDIFIWVKTVSILPKRQGTYPDFGQICSVFARFLYESIRINAFSHFEAGEKKFDELCKCG